jgi:hypothetical protein
VESLPVRTNIIPVDPEQIEQTQSEQPATEVQSSAQEQTGPYSEKLAQDAIRFMEEEFKGDIDDVFWRYIRDKAQEKLQRESTVKEIRPMTEEERKNFLDQELPWGRYSGRKVKNVLRKDAEYLKQMVDAPLPFQTRLKRFLIGLEKSS